MAERIEWVPVEELRQYVRFGAVTDGLSLSALLAAFQFGVLD